MGVIVYPEPAVLICGILAMDAHALDLGRARLEQALGLIDQTSPAWPFQATDYYESELGKTPLRQFVTFREPFETERLADIKLLTNELEFTLACEIRGNNDIRPVNLDPGYVTPAKLVLATTKDRSHRIYLRNGIFAEVTLQYIKRTWQGQPWTYRDYASDPNYHDFFSSIRQQFLDSR